MIRVLYNHQQKHVLCSNMSLVEAPPSLSSLCVPIISYMIDSAVEINIAFFYRQTATQCAKIIKGNCTNRWLIFEKKLFQFWREI